MSKYPQTTYKWTFWVLKPATLKQRLFAAWMVFRCRNAVIAGDEASDQWIHFGDLADGNIEQAKVFTEAMNEKV